MPSQSPACDAAPLSEVKTIRSAGSVPPIAISAPRAAAVPLVGRR
jgi:hypothetical protein